MKDYNVKDYRKEMWNGFKQYYVYYLYCGGCDPSYDILNYISEKENIPLDDRYLIALLYGSTYSDPATYTLYEKIPNMLNLSHDEMKNKWFEVKPNVEFTSDRKKVKNFNELPNIIKSYKELIGDETQTDFFDKFVELDCTPQERYEKLYEVANKIHYFGRFSLFNYLESLNELTPINVIPTTLDLKNAESARNGLCYACGVPNQVTLHHKKPREKIDYEFLYSKLEQLEKELQSENPEINVNIFNIETALCGYKKLFWESRYLGYYIDRHGAGVHWHEKHNPDISYNLFWRFRDKYLKPFFNNIKIQKERCKYVNTYGKLINPETNLFGEREEMPIFKIENLVPHLRK